MPVAQTQAEQKPRPPTPDKKTPPRPQNGIDKRPIHNSSKQESVFSKVRLKRNTATPIQNEYSSAALLGSLPIIPEKGDPSVAIQQLTGDNSAVSPRNGSRLALNQPANLIE